MIQITRRTGLFGMGLSVTIYQNGTEIGKLKHQESQTFDVDSGSEITCKQTGARSNSLIVNEEDRLTVKKNSRTQKIFLCLLLILPCLNFLPSNSRMIGYVLWPILIIGSLFLLEFFVLEKV